MRKEDFYEILGEIDEKYIIDARTKNPIKIKWVTRAACFCFIIGILALYHIGRLNTVTGLQAANSYGININGDTSALYFSISNDEREEFGIPLNYVPTAQDLGEQVGIVKNTQRYHYKGLNGCKVYRSAKHSEKDSIRIVEMSRGYQYYVCKYLDYVVKIGETSDIMLDTYKLPESLEKMELLTVNTDFTHSEEKYLYQTITDVGDSILEIISGKINLGSEAISRRFAQIWYDTYGNDDVYYSEKDGKCIFRMDSDTANNIDELANELWLSKNQLIKITIDRGFELNIEYNPIARYIHSGNEYYDVSDNDVEKLNQLLQLGIK